MPVDTRSFGGIGVFAIYEMGCFYCRVLIQKRYPHHGTVAFVYCGKEMFGAPKYFGVSVLPITSPGYYLVGNKVLNHFVPVREYTLHQRNFQLIS